MKSPNNKTSQDVKEHLPNRPLLVSIACIFSFVYFGFLLLTFIVSLFFPGFVLQVIQQYYPDSDISGGIIYLSTILGILLFGTAFYGVLNIWFLRKRGFFLYLSSKITIIALLAITGYFNYINAIITLFILLIYWSYYKKYR